ncbi:MAG: multiheme c-type cytochrome [Mariprofundaceae bacterium]
MKKIILPLSLLAGGLILLFLYVNSDQSIKSGQVSSVNASESKDSSFIEAYWNYTVATKGEAPHDWSALEKNLKPEACAQCHIEQFSAWKKSLHAHAYSPGLIGQFPDMGHVSGNDDCLKCHAPLKEQKYSSRQDMLESLSDKLAHPEGFSQEGKLGEINLPLRHTGVSCAVCHVRGWQRFGPPQRNTGAIGKIEGEAHSGFTGSKDFERSSFCATCHQFPQSYAINGKPLENTVKEWQESRFAREGVHCQNCHMPDRKHEFRGIHDPEMVRKGLNFKLEQKGDGAVLSIESKWIGHAFPTYVTPKVIILAEAVDHRGESLRKWQWEIIREVYVDGGWKERRDTRLMPGEIRKFEASSAPAETVQIRYSVHVIPDYFYKGVYQGLLHGALEADAERLIRQAVEHADSNDYTLYEGLVKL